MEKKTLRKFKWFWAWQDEAEEAWLREMAKNGWHLSQIVFPTVYEFRSGELKDIVYRLDYRAHWRMEKDDYMQLFQDSGWEHVQETAGWHYFRQLTHAGEDLEIFTDAESKIDKYQRLLTFLGILALPLIVLIINFRNPPPYDWFSPIRVIMVLIFVLYVYAFIRILMRINQLKRI
ncbi:MAG: DUF2812 domain-containing protein [Chloroflexota bacterium]|nr:MAG: DUF2812 domain-containing protein [Chloroflexota bacterium]